MKFSVNIFVFKERAIKAMLLSMYIGVVFHGMYKDIFEFRRQYYSAYVCSFNYSFPREKRFECIVPLFYRMLIQLTVFDM